MGVSAVPMSVVPMSVVPMSAVPMSAVHHVSCCESFIMSANVHHVSCCELLSAVVSCWPFFRNKLLFEVQVQEEEQ